MPATSSATTLIGDLNLDGQTIDRAAPTNSTTPVKQTAYAKKYYHVKQNTARNVIIKKGMSRQGNGNAIPDSSSWKICCSGGYGKNSQTSTVNVPTDSASAAICKTYNSTDSNPENIYLNKWLDGYSSYTFSAGTGTGTKNADTTYDNNTDYRPLCWFQQANAAQDGNRYCIQTIPRSAFDGLNNSSTNKQMTFICTGLNTNSKNSGTGTFSQPTDV
uniref:Uncharacterized protein n=1 Tax=viral metagenome TaxID=1070528 RepID=A0A6C0D316_9ZZZZ